MNFRRRICSNFVFNLYLSINIYLYLNIYMYTTGTRVPVLKTGTRVPSTFTKQVLFTSTHKKYSSTSTRVPSPHCQNIAYQFVKFFIQAK